MKQDLQWLRVCDALFRLAGESKGADIEVALAMELGKLVFSDIYEIAKLGKVDG